MAAIGSRWHPPGDGSRRQLRSGLAPDSAHALGLMPTAAALRGADSAAALRWDPGAWWRRCVAGAGCAQQRRHNRPNAEPPGRRPGLRVVAAAFDARACKISSPAEVLRIRGRRIPDRRRTAFYPVGNPQPTNLGQHRSPRPSFGARSLDLSPVGTGAVCRVVDHEALLERAFEADGHVRGREPSDQG